VPARAFMGALPSLVQGGQSLAHLPNVVVVGIIVGSAASDQVGLGG
jgi:hypothetical protein